MHAQQRLSREWYSPWDTTSAYLGGSSTYNRTDPAESSGPGSTSHGHMRSGRGFCELTNPRSPLQALAIDPGSSDHQKKSIILIAWMESSTKEGRAGWPGVGLWGHQVRTRVRSGQSKVGFSILCHNYYGTTFGSCMA